MNQRVVEQMPHQGHLIQISVAFTCMDVIVPLIEYLSWYHIFVAGVLFRHPFTNECKYKLQDNVIEHISTMNLLP